MASPTPDDIIVIIPGEDGGVFFAGKSSWQARNKSLMAQVLDEVPGDVIPEVIEQLKSKLPKSSPLIDRPPREDYGITGPVPVTTSPQTTTDGDDTEATYAEGMPESATTLLTPPDKDGSRDYDNDHLDKVGATHNAG